MRRDDQVREVVWVSPSGNRVCACDPVCLSAVPGDVDPCGVGDIRWATWWTRPSDPMAYSYGEQDADLLYGSSIKCCDLRGTIR